MSRSYKKVRNCETRTRKIIIISTEKIRRDKSKIPNGGAFKKHSPHWYSWAYIWPLEDAIKSYEKGYSLEKEISYFRGILIWYKKAFLSK